MGDRPHSNWSRWIVIPKPRREPVARLFCFPHAGVGSGAYRGWADAAPEGLEVCLIQPPGRENRLREAPLKSVADIVAGLVAELEPHCGIPFAFFGHSLGAVVAFETVRRLQHIGARLPEALFVAASRAPQLAWPHPPLRHLADIPLLEMLNKRYDSVPSVMLADAELRDLLMPAVRADITAVETYLYESGDPLDLPVFAFGGDEDRMVGQQELEHWRAQTTGGFRLHMVSGKHLFAQEKRDDLIPEIAAALSVPPDHRGVPAAK